MKRIVLLAIVLSACSRKSEPAPAVDAAPPAESTTHGEIAGLRFIEHMTGGARSDERVPMIVAMHGMGGEPSGMLPLFQNYRRRARLVLAYGHASGGKYIWFDNARDDVPFDVVTREADRVVTAIAALAKERPTVGKPIFMGFSQGGMMTFSLAVTHPDAMAAAFPVGGLLPLSLYSRKQSTTLPPVTAFHGASDMAVPAIAARESIGDLKHAGFPAELREFVGVEHAISDEEDAELLEQIGRAADAQH